MPPRGDKTSVSSDLASAASPPSSAAQQQQAPPPLVGAQGPGGLQTEENAKRAAQLFAGVGVGGSPAGRYQLTDKFVIPSSSLVVPVRDRNIRDGDVVEAVLYYWDTEVWNPSASDGKVNVGFKSGFEVKVSNRQVEFPQLKTNTKKPIMMTARPKGGTGKLQRNGKKSADPRMDFPFWIKLRTKETRTEIPMPQQWRFQLMTSLNQIDDDDYKKWREEETDAHNTAKKVERAKRDKAEKTEGKASDLPKKPSKKRRKVKSEPNMDAEMSSSGGNDVSLMSSSSSGGGSASSASSLKSETGASTESGRRRGRRAKGSVGAGSTSSSPASKGTAFRLLQRDLQSLVPGPDGWATPREIELRETVQVLESTGLAKARKLMKAVKFDFLFWDPSSRLPVPQDDEGRKLLSSVSAGTGDSRAIVVVQRMPVPPGPVLEALRRVPESTSSFGENTASQEVAKAIADLHELKGERQEVEQFAQNYFLRLFALFQSKSSVPMFEAVLAFQRHFGHLGDGATRRLLEVHRLPGFDANASEVSCQERLQQADIKTYVVRYSRSQFLNGGFAISVRDDKEDAIFKSELVKHFQVQFDMEQKVYLLSDSEHLVEHLSLLIDALKQYFQTPLESLTV